MARNIIVSALSSRSIEVNKGQKTNEIIMDIKKYWQKKIDQVLPDQPDLIVLPEACDRPNFSLIEDRLKYYNERGEEFKKFFSSIARENNCYIAYSAVREIPDGTRRNSTQIIDRRGKVAGIYNKNFPISDGETQAQNILCGKDASIIECDFGSVGCVICFDLNFDELREKYSKQKPDIIIFSSMFHGGFKSNYWAYDCQAYFMGAIGGHTPSYIISPLGETIGSSTEVIDYKGYITKKINLDYQIVQRSSNINKLEAAKRKYGRNIKICDPGYIGVIMISSEVDGISSNDIVEEFGIVRLVDYYQETRVNRLANTEK